MLDTLPQEILLRIFEYGGVDFLCHGPAATCSALRRVSFDNHLWNNALTDYFASVGLYPHQVDEIPNIRQWYFVQLAACRAIEKRVNRLVFLSLEPSSARNSVAAETAALCVVQHGLLALPALTRITNQPASLAHFHWAHWLIEVARKFEGIQRLLKLSLKDSYGNQPASNPVDHVIALLFLRTNTMPTKFTDVVYADNWKDVFIDDVGEQKASDICAATNWGINLINSLDSVLAKKSDLYSTLLKSALFTHIVGEKLQFDVKILTFPMSTYCCVRTQNDEFVFVDFSRGGKLRSVPEIQDRLALTNTPGNQVRYGISLYDILATVYVWHSMPSFNNRKTVLELIEHAALDANVHKGRHFPTLYSQLVRRAIAKNVAEVDDINHAESSDADAGDSISLFDVGQVCRLVGVTPGPEHCVVLEASTESYSVLRGSLTMRVLPSMLVKGYHGKVNTVGGLTVPDIEGLDMRALGEHFLQYNESEQKFTATF